MLFQDSAVEPDVYIAIWLYRILIRFIRHGNFFCYHSLEVQAHFQLGYISIHISDIWHGITTPTTVSGTAIWECADLLFGVTLRYTHLNQELILELCFDDSPAELFINFRHVSINVFRIIYDMWNFSGQSTSLNVGAGTLWTLSAFECECFISHRH